ncbi:MAG: plasmid-related protein [Candidatus Thiodiazotropha sp.]
MGKTSELKVRVEPELLEQFRASCLAEEKKISTVIRELMQTFIDQQENRLQGDLFETQLNKQ